MSNNERVSTAFIPVNFQTGINLLGQTYPLINIVEGGVLLVAVTIGTFLLLRNFTNFEISTIIGISITLGLPLGVFGLLGINDENIHSFIINVIKFSKNKRITYYNPRIKKEARPINISEFKESDVELLPRDKVMKMYENFKKMADEKDRNKMLESEEDINNNSTMMFEDDEILNETSKNKKK